MGDRVSIDLRKILEQLELYSKYTGWQEIEEIDSSVKRDSAFLLDIEVVE